MTAADRSRPRLHIPALLTLTRVVLAIPVVIFVLKRTDTASWIAFFAFGIGALTDGLDGIAARKMQLVSKTGQLWDPIADKVLVLVTVITLVYVDRFPAWAAAIIIAREAAVTVLRLVADRRGHGFAASWTGKFKTATQLLVLLLALTPAGTVARWVFDIALWSAVILSVVSGLQYLVRAPALLQRKVPDAR